MLIVAGIGTDIGKTTYALQLAKERGAHYWKPIECGENTDSEKAIQLLGKNAVYPPVYSFKAPVSPHFAAAMEGTLIDLEKIVVPECSKLLIVEMAGGILTPLSIGQQNMHLFSRWRADWIVVSRHYLGSINHTLLTLEILKQWKIKPNGIVFSGKENPAGEQAILAEHPYPVIGRVFHEERA